MKNGVPPKGANANHVATANPRKAKGQEKQESPVESPTVAVAVVK